MDHRYSIRTPLRVAVDVFKRERFLGRCITRNMDVEGVFIEAPTIDLEPNDVVRLVFVVPGYERCDCALIAGVARRDADGLGIMLFDHEHNALDMLRAAHLSSHKPGRLFQARPGSTNPDDYGFAVKYQA